MGKKRNKAKAAEVAIVEPELIQELTDRAKDLTSDDPTEARIAEQPVVETPQDFDTMLASVSVEAVQAKVDATCSALRERSDFEAIKDPENKKIQKTIDSVWKQITTHRAARLMCAVNFDPETLNRVIHEGARYNIYAMGKLSDAIWGLTNSEDGKRGQITNAINLACMRSLFRFRADGTQFTGEMAKAAASDKIRVDAKVRELLVRHTVSASTAPTQASSTMQALESLGIVRRSGSGKNPNFDLTANPIVAALEKALAA